MMTNASAISSKLAILHSETFNHVRVQSTGFSASGGVGNEAYVVTGNVYIPSHDVAVVFTIDGHKQENLPRAILNTLTVSR